MVERKRQPEAFRIYRHDRVLEQVAEVNGSLVLEPVHLMAMDGPTLIDVLKYTLDRDLTGVDEPKLCGPRIERNLLDLLSDEKLERGFVRERVHAGRWTLAAA